MQKFDIPCIKTGEFAALCGTNKRTLFHYDEIGLFSPAYTDEKGYRYYSEQQCDVFFTITCLKELGMPLKDIKKYIDRKDPADFEALLLEQQKKVEAELKQLAHIRTVINTKLSLVRQGRKLEDVTDLSEIRLEEQKEDELLILSEPVFSSDHDTVFSALCSHIGECNRYGLNSGHPYGAMLPQSAVAQGEYDTYACFFTKTSLREEDIPACLKVHRKAAGTYASIYLRGNYYQADEALQRLCSFQEKSAPSPTASSTPFFYKEAVLDEMAVEESRLLTRISFLLQSKRA